MRIMLLSEGINNNPELWTDWLNPIIPMIHLRQVNQEWPLGSVQAWKAQGIFYSTTALSVEQHEADRVQTLADIMKAYGKLETHAIGHSNGTRVILSALQSQQFAIHTIHLLCGAVDADFNTNGLNFALKSGQVGDVFVYVASNDSAMRIEDTAPGDLLFGIPFGHKPLGFAGPANVDPSVAGRVHVITWTGYDHSTCWDADHFTGTVNQIMSLAESKS